MNYNLWREKAVPAALRYENSRNENQDIDVLLDTRAIKIFFYRHYHDNGPINSSALSKP